MSLNLHNRHVDDQGAGEGEVLLEGVDAEMMEAEEAEEMGQDLFDSVVCKKILRNRANAEALPSFCSARK